MIGRIDLTAAESAEGLRLERELARAQDLMHVAENDLNRYVNQLAALRGVPAGWKLIDWLHGFVPAEVAEAHGENNHDG